MAPDVETRNVAAEDARSGVRPVDLPPAALAPPATPCAPGRELSTTARDARDVYAYERAAPGESIVVAVNFGSTATRLRVRTGRRWTVLFDTHARPTTELVGDDHLTLAPREAVILVAG